MVQALPGEEDVRTITTSVHPKRQPWLLWTDASIQPPKPSNTRLHSARFISYTLPPTMLVFVGSLTGPAALSKTVSSLLPFALKNPTLTLRRSRVDLQVGLRGSYGLKSPSIEQSLFSFISSPAHTPQHRPVPA